MPYREDLRREAARYLVSLGKASVPFLRELMAGSQRLPVYGPGDKVYNGIAALSGQCYEESAAKRSVGATETAEQWHALGRAFDRAAELLEEEDLEDEDELEEDELEEWDDDGLEEEEELEDAEEGF